MSPPVVRWLVCACLVGGCSSSHLPSHRTGADDAAAEADHVIAIQASGGSTFAITAQGQLWGWGIIPDGGEEGLISSGRDAWYRTARPVLIRHGPNRPVAFAGVGVCVLEEDGGLVCDSPRTEHWTRYRVGGRIVSANNGVVCAEVDGAALVTGLATGRQNRIPLDGSHIMGCLAAGSAVIATERAVWTGPWDATRETYVLGRQDAPGEVVTIGMSGEVVVRSGQIFEVTPDGELVERLSLGARILSYDTVVAERGEAGGCAVLEDGAVRCWPGLDIEEWACEYHRPASGPVRSFLVDGILARQVDVGLDHACALDLDGRVFCWGRTAGGAVGVETPACQTTPFEVRIPPP